MKKCGEEAMGVSVGVMDVGHGVKVGSRVVVGVGVNEGTSVAVGVAVCVAATPALEPHAESAIRHTRLMEIARLMCGILYHHVHGMVLS